MEDTITISMEEYKELLMIKGKYEEIKNLQNNKNNTIYRNNSGYKMPEPPYKITCKDE